MSDLETDASPVSGAEAPRQDRKDRPRKERTHQQRKDNIGMDDKGRLHYSSPEFSAQITLSGVQNLQIGSNNVMYVNNSGNNRRKFSATKPLSDSTEELTPAQHKMIAQELGRDWRKLGRGLGLSEGQLDNIRADYRVEGQKEIAFQTVREWMKQEGEDATVAVMAKALDDISRGDIADKLHD